VSSLISPPETERVKSWIDDAVGAGAKVAVGGEVNGRMLEPTVLTDVSPDMKVCSEEVFGPVVAVAAYDDVDEALRLANDTRYGLQALIMTPPKSSVPGGHERSTSSSFVEDRRCNRSACRSPTAALRSTSSYAATATTGPKTLLAAHLHVGETHREHRRFEHAAVHLAADRHLRSGADRVVDPRLHPLGLRREINDDTSVASSSGSPSTRSRT